MRAVKRKNRGRVDVVMLPVSGSGPQPPGAVFDAPVDRVIIAVIQSQERMIVAAELAFHRDRERCERLNADAKPPDVHVVILLSHVGTARGATAGRAAEATLKC